MTTPKLNFQLIAGDLTSSAAIFIDGQPYNYLSTQPNWEEVVQILTDSLVNPPADVDRLLSIINPAKKLEITFKRLSDRFVFRKGKVLFDGVPVQNAVVEHLKKILEDPEAKDEDYQYLVRFMDKLYQNPSQESIDNLYKYLDTHGFIIDEDGDLIAHKGVRKDYGSHTAGPGIVNGVEFEDAVHLDNSLGNVIEMPRPKVDANRNVTCSVGLHAGTHEYVQWFLKNKMGESRVIHVKINPRDVVSVPFDHSNSKMRVSRYIVIGEGNDTFSGPTYHKVSIPEDKPEVAPEPEPVVESEPEATPEPEAAPEVSEADAAEFAPEERAAAAEADAPTESASAEVDPNSFEGRVARMKVVIGTLPKGTNLKRYRNKSVTAKNRLPFDEALRQIEDES